MKHKGTTSASAPILQPIPNPQSTSLLMKLIIQFLLKKIMKRNTFATSFFPFLTMTLVLIVVAFVLALKYFITESTLSQLNITKCQTVEYERYLSHLNYLISFILISLTLFFHLINIIIALIVLLCRNNKPENRIIPLFLVQALLAGTSMGKVTLIFYIFRKCSVSNDQIIIILGFLAAVFLTSLIKILLLLIKINKDQQTQINTSQANICASNQDLSFHQAEHQTMEYFQRKSQKIISQLKQQKSPEVQEQQTYQKLQASQQRSFSSFQTVSVMIIGEHQEENKKEQEIILESQEFELQETEMNLHKTVRKIKKMEESEESNSRIRRRNLMQQYEQIL